MTSTGTFGQLADAVALRVGHGRPHGHDGGAESARTVRAIAASARADAFAASASRELALEQRSRAPPSMVTSVARTRWRFK